MKKLLIPLSLFFGFSLHAQDYPEAIYTINGVAIDGYDAVAYFLQNSAVKGSKEFVHKWNGSTWQFASASNRDAFKQNPEKYAPQYGGYCAYGMSQGYKAKVDPINAWTIVNGKLYLNYNKGIKAKWLPKKDELINKADVNWKKIE
jgi:YHS domain-containing protein